jgi:hypothetical protein
MIHKKYRTFVSLTAGVFMLACAVPGLVPEPIPTFDANAPLTSIVLTADEAATQTALLTTPSETPTLTPPPTNTPTETGTPTFIFSVATHTLTPTPVTLVPSNVDFACQVVAQFPANESVMARGETFEARWRVVNVGNRVWERGSADYIYFNGSALHRASRYDFSITVAPRVSVELVVSMQAPTEPGTYTTGWRINIGRNNFCPMTLTIVVN